jgi:ribonuclease Z
MGRIIVLGSGHAVPDLEHENTHLIAAEGDHVIMIDCASNPVLQLARAGIQLDQVSDIILTHFHPDHVSGTPLLILSMWLTGRKKNLNIYGLVETLSRMKVLMGLYDWEKWPDVFPIQFIEVEHQELAQVISTPSLSVFASTVKHLIPTIGLRLEFIQESRVVAYSCDTEPCLEVVHLAQNADILFHEATGATLGHSSALQAVDIAKQAGAKKLYLIHYSARGEELEILLQQAKQKFDGPVELATDFQMIDLIQGSTNLSGRVPIH